MVTCKHQKCLYVKVSMRSKTTVPKKYSYARIEHGHTVEDQTLVFKALHGSAAVLSLISAPFLPSDYSDLLTNHCPLFPPPDKI